MCFGRQLPGSIRLFWFLQQRLPQGAGAHSQNGAPSLTPGSTGAKLRPLCDRSRPGHGEISHCFGTFFTSLRRSHETSRSSLTHCRGIVGPCCASPDTPCPKQPAAGDPALSVAPEIDRRGEIVAARGAARAVNGRPHQDPERAWNPLVAATNGTDAPSSPRPAAAPSEPTCGARETVNTLPKSRRATPILRPDAGPA